MSDQGGQSGYGSGQRYGQGGSQDEGQTQQYGQARSRDDGPYGQDQGRDQGQAAYGQQAPYGQEPAGQDQYGQDQYGQAQAGHAQAGQAGPAQYGQAQYGQDQYGQDQYGQDQYGQAQAGQAHAGQGQYGGGQYGYPAGAAASYPQGYASTGQMPAVDAKGFFASLFDFSFTSLVTPKIVKVLYALITIVLGLFLLVLVIEAFGAGPIRGVIALIFGVILYFIYLALWRIALEVIMVIFRISDDVRSIAGRGGTN